MLFEVLDQKVEGDDIVDRTYSIWYELFIPLPQAKERVLPAPVGNNARDKGSVSDLGELLSRTKEGRSPQSFASQAREPGLVRAIIPDALYDPPDRRARVHEGTLEIPVIGTIKGRPREGDLLQRMGITTRALGARTPPADGSFPSPFFPLRGRPSKFFFDTRQIRARIWQVVLEIFSSSP